MFLILLTPPQTYSDEFLAENNREEWLWKCRRRQWDKWPQDHGKADNMKSRLVKWGICTEAEFDLRMNVVQLQVWGDEVSLICFVGNISCLFLLFSEIAIACKLLTRNT